MIDFITKFFSYYYYTALFFHVDGDQIQLRHLLFLYLILLVAEFFMVITAKNPKQKWLLFQVNGFLCAFLLLAGFLIDLIKPGYSIAWANFFVFHYPMPILYFYIVFSTLPALLIGLLFGRLWTYLFGPRK